MATHCKPVLTLNLATLWGAFLHEGMMDDNRQHEVLNCWTSGCIELIQAVCNYVPIMWQEASAYYGQPRDFPGVFEYEVVSAFGGYLGDYLLAHDGTLPSLPAARLLFKGLVVQFFQLDTADQPPLH